MDIKQLFAVAATRAPSPDEIAACCSSIGIDVDVALNSIAMTLAERYDSGKLGFAESDRFVNRLYSWCLFTRNRVLPEPAHQIFLAFDAGEFHRSEDSRAVDPEAKYTRPMIKEVLSSRDAV